MGGAVVGWTVVVVDVGVGVRMVVFVAVTEGKTEGGKDELMTPRTKETEVKGLERSVDLLVTPESGEELEARETT